MKQSAARVFCAAALMLTALATSVGLMGAVFAENEVPEEDRVVTAHAPRAPQQEKEADLVLVRMLFVAQPGIHQIRLCNQKRQILQQLTPDAEGVAVCEPIQPGKYIAQTSQGDVAFTLLENASIKVDSGPGWTDGEQLHLTSDAVGTVTVLRSVTPSELESSAYWLEYTLSDSAYYAREVIYHDGANSTVLACTFYGVPYGSFVLKENGIQCATVALSSASSEVIIELPTQN